MKSIIIAAIAVFASACSTVHDYALSNEGHKAHVMDSFECNQGIVVNGNVDMYFTVNQSGQVDSVELQGGTVLNKRHALQILDRAQPFAKHDQDQPATYAITFSQDDTCQS